MTEEKDLLSHAATVLSVRDITASMQFYTNQMGFTIYFTWKEPIDYAVLKRGGVGLHLVQSPIRSQINPACIYSFVQDINELYKEFEYNGIKNMSSLNQEDYGMKEFELKDPDGHRLIFGQGS